MERTESAGIGIAIIGHVLLILALKYMFDQAAAPPARPEAMEVSFVEEMGPVSSAPESSEMPAPSFGEELAPPEEASGATPAPPEPITAPIPEPVRPPVETSERRRPEPTRNPVQVRPAPPPRVAPNSTRPRPQQRPVQQRPQPRAGQGQGNRSSGFDARRLAESLGRGPPAARGTAPNPPAQLSGAQRQQLARNISGLIAPCATRARAPNPFARTISVDLRVTVTAGGAPTGHQLLGSSGTNAQNSDYVDDVVAVAMRAVRACASRIASLPDDHYAIPGGWRTFRYRFRFP